KCGRTRSRATTGSTKTAMTMTTRTGVTMTTRADLENTLRRLRLFGCLARLDEIEGEDWLERLITIEIEERTRRSLANRTRIAGLGNFKPLSDFDWTWPKKLDRMLLDDLQTLRFVAEGANVVLLGPNGVGKTMLLKNLASRALHGGHRV